MRRDDPTLEELDLWANITEPDEVLALAEELTVNTMLARLNLGGNYIGDATGVLALAEALKMNTDSLVWTSAAMTSGSMGARTG